MTNCITEKGKYDLAPRILTINCSLVTKKYTFQYNKGMLVAVRTNYTKILVFCAFCRWLKVVYQKQELRNELSLLEMQILTMMR